MGNQPSSPNIGYRILGIQPNSPAARSDLIPFFDFIVGCTGQLLFQSIHNPYLHRTDGITDVSSSDCKNWESNAVGSHGNDHSNPCDLDFLCEIQDAIRNSTPLELLIYSIKSRSSRCVSISFDDFDGHDNDSSMNKKDQLLLGAVIRLDDYSEHVEDNILRCLDAKPGSPAECAGIHPMVDYILCTNDVVFSDLDMFAEVLQCNENKAMDVYVYNSESDHVRVVQLIPTFAWVCNVDINDNDDKKRVSFNQRSLFGAEVGIGFMHRLPSTCRQTDGFLSLSSKISNVPENHTVTNRNSASASGKSCLSDIEAEVMNDVVGDDEREKSSEKRYSEQQGGCADLIINDSDNRSDNESDSDNEVEFQFSRPLDEYEPIIDNISDNDDVENVVDSLASANILYDSDIVLSQEITKTEESTQGEEENEFNLDRKKPAMELEQDQHNVLYEQKEEVNDTEEFHLVSPMDPFESFPIIQPMRGSFIVSKKSDKEIFSDDIPPPPSLSPAVQMASPKR